jgi:hypothetical protein
MMMSGSVRFDPTIREGAGCHSNRRPDLNAAGATSDANVTVRKK